MELQTVDRAHFDLLKQTVHIGAAASLIAAHALREIKQKGYWKADGHESWEKFVASEYGWTKKYAQQLVVDSNTINALPEKFRAAITSHAAARELSKYEPAFRESIIDVASNGGKKQVTSTAIKNAAPKKSSPPPPKKKSAASSAPPPKKAAAKAKGVEDETGLEVPKESLELWNRGAEVEELLIYLGYIRRRLQKAETEKDKLFSELNFGSILASENQLRIELCQAVPWAVCHSCQGKLPADCATCKGRGFVSRFFWENCVPIESREVRVKKD